MAIAKHDGIVKAIVDALLVNPALAGGNVSAASDFDWLPTTASTGVRVELFDSEPLQSRYGTVDWRSTIRVACFARDDRFGADGQPSTQLAASAYARLMATPGTLGGLAESIGAPRISRDLELRASRTGGTHLDFPVRHRTTDRILT